MLRWIKKKDRRTESIAMKGEATVRSLTTALVSAECWFTVQPLPDQVWRITVEEDDMPVLLSAMAHQSRPGVPKVRQRIR